MKTVINKSFLILVMLVAKTCFSQINELTENDSIKKYDDQFIQKFINDTNVFNSNTTINIIINTYGTISSITHIAINDSFVNSKLYRLYLDTFYLDKSKDFLLKKDIDYTKIQGYYQCINYNNPGNFSKIVSIYHGSELLSRIMFENIKNDNLSILYFHDIEVTLQLINDYGFL